MENQDMEMAITTTTDQVVLLMNQQDDQKAQNSPKERIVNSSVSQDQNLRKTSTPLRLLSFSKPKSRLIEQHYPLPNPKPIHDSEELDQNHASSTDNDDEGEGNEGGIFWLGKGRKRKRKISWRALIEWALFLTTLTCLVCSTTIGSLKRKVVIWGLELWKWWLMAMVIFSGRLASGWMVAFLAFFIERNFMLRENVVYFVYGLRKSFQSCVWLRLVLLASAEPGFFLIPVYQIKTMLKILEITINFYSIL